ncbi:hypothetical protein A9R05_45135 (plasmid) [Burkholderia sp. KK1]|nr:hypothetical protein A9R05_45135 [Burkholderia sp. KK1]
MSSYSYALEARAAWALHVVAVIAGDLEAADAHRAEAQILAMASGRASHTEGVSRPNLVSDVPAPVGNWTAGWNERARAALPTINDLIEAALNANKVTQ